MSVLRGGSSQSSVVVTSNLRRAIATGLISLWERLRGGEERYLVHSALQVSTAQLRRTSARPPLFPPALLRGGPWVRSFCLRYCTVRGSPSLRSPLSRHGACIFIPWHGMAWHERTAVAGLGYCCSAWVCVRFHLEYTDRPFYRFVRYLITPSWLSAVARVGVLRAYVCM